MRLIQRATASLVRAVLSRPVDRRVSVFRFIERVQGGRARLGHFMQEQNHQSVQRG